jgi:hypothetical protein
MKLCPQCQEQFDDRQAFCDQDGAVLVDHTEVIRVALHQAQPRQASNAWITGTIGGFIGIIVCVLLYALFLAGNQGEPADGPATHSSPSQEQAPVRTQLAAAPAPGNTPVAEEQPSPEEDASRSPAPAEAAGAPAPTAAPLNTGPIATGTKQSREGEKALIKMKDGSSVEADAAWEDEQGIWYRRSGLVSFVEKSRVEAITDLPQRQPAKSETRAP